MGSWSLNGDGSVLTIGYDALGMDIIISNPVLNTTTNILSGTILFPFPENATQPINPSTNMQLVNVYVEFLKI
jgi:hypothetical protein